MKVSGRQTFREWHEKLKAAHPELTKALSEKPSLKTWDPGEALKYALHVYQAQFGLYSQYRYRSQLRKASPSILLQQGLFAYSSSSTTKQFRTTVLVLHSDPVLCVQPNNFSTAHLRICLQEYDFKDTNFREIGQVLGNYECKKA